MNRSKKAMAAITAAVMLAAPGLGLLEGRRDKRDRSIDAVLKRAKERKSKPAWDVKA